jgi:hypothetical protein
VRTKIVVTASIIALLVVGFLFISDTVFNFGFGIIRDSLVSSSVATLIQVRSVLSLNTVEVVRKVVFPYDFVPADMDWDLFFKQREKRPLSLLEQQYFDTYEICEKIGFNLRSKRREFVVITVIIKAGFDLSNPVFTSPEQVGEELAGKYVRADSPDAITILLPPAVLTALIIEDADTESYPYPDIRIGPEDWKALTSFVKERIESEVASGEVLTLAAENGRQFLRRMFLDSGYSSVSFSE